MKKVLVFGTFDKLHSGHDDFFKQVQKLGDEIIVSLAQNETVNKLKGQHPIESFEDRKKALKKYSAISNIIPGDLTIGTFQAVEKTKPDIVATGYDQDKLETAIRKWLVENNSSIEIVKLKPFEPTKYKSSLLRNKI